MNHINKFIITLVFFSGISFPQTEPLDGDSDGKREVYSLDHLLWISTHTAGWGYSYEQTADIDASSTSGWGGGGFSPIGNTTVNFTGVYDGQGYKISQLYINRETDYNAFFGCLSGATISNLQLYQAQIHGDNFTGALFGTAMSSTISNCSSTFYVNGSHSYTGGLGGYASGCTITDCYSTASVYGGTAGTGDQMYTGGLIGELSGSSILRNSYYNGAVSGHNFTGGLIGTCSCQEVSKCYSKGSVMGNDRTGGLIGHLNNDIDNCYSRSAISVNVTGSEVGGLFGAVWNNTISNCYSTGTVSGTSSVGGLIGYNYSPPTISGCFWDTQTSGSSSSAGGTGKTTAEMKTQSTFTDAGWSTSIWNMDSGNDGYPYFDWENPGGSPLPVELTFFTSQVINNDVYLKWETSAEIDNYGFEVQRVKSEELNVKSFETIGFVQGAGNSSSPRSYSFADRNLANGDYLYRLKQINTNGSFDYWGQKEAHILFTPGKFELSQNYPNPVNDLAIIKYQLSVDCYVTVKIYDALGSEISVLVNEQKPAGIYKVQLDATRLTSGVYYYRINAGGFRAVKRLINIR